MGSFLSKNHGICTEGILVCYSDALWNKMYVIHSMVIGQKTFTMPQDKVLIYV